MDDKPVLPGFSRKPEMIRLVKQPVTGCSDDEVNIGDKVPDRKVNNIDDLVMAIVAGDLATVLSSLTERDLDVNAPIPVLGGEVTSLTLLATTHVQPKILKVFIERGGWCGGKGLLALAGGVSQHTNKEELVECATLVWKMEGEDLNSMKIESLTPLMIASRGGCEAMVVWLVDTGADLNMTDSVGWSALMMGVDREWDEIVSLLLEKGADPMLVSCGGQKAVDIAASNGS